MLHEELASQNPYDLKREGSFPKALRAYGKHYADATEIGDHFLQEQCFMQMFDVCLLGYLRESRLFESRIHLKEAIGREIADVLNHLEVFDQAIFEGQMRKCWTTFSGKGKSPFSVDKNWLVPARKKRRDSHNEAQAH